MTKTSIVERLLNGNFITSEEADILLGKRKGVINSHDSTLISFLPYLIAYPLEKTLKEVSFLERNQSRRAKIKGIRRLLPYIRAVTIEIATIQK